MKLICNLKLALLLNDASDRDGCATVRRGRPDDADDHVPGEIHCRGLPRHSAYGAVLIGIGKAPSREPLILRPRDNEVCFVSQCARHSVT